MRTFLELEASTGAATEFLRSLFGMAAVYLAPLIFFVVRESHINDRIAVMLLVIACVVSLLSQMGLLSYGESLISGTVNLASIFGIERRDQWLAPFELGYAETTITIWRALSVGLTFALLLSKTKLWVKVLGAVGFILQFAGGGGGRSALLFVFLVPIVLFLFQGSVFKRQRLKKLLWVGAISVVFAALYLWAPVGGEGAVKGGYEKSHYERASEIFTFFTEGSSGAAAIGGFDGRTITWGEYIGVIFSNPSIFFFGIGLGEGSAFAWTQLGVAHNMILDTWGLSGLIGVVFLLIFLGYILSDLNRLIKATPKETRSQIIALSFAVSILFMFQWLLFQPSTGDRSFMIVFYLLAGLLKPTTKWLQENIDIVRK